MKKIVNIENDEYKNNFNRSRSIIMKNSIKEEEHDNNVEIENKLKKVSSYELKKKLKEKKEKFYLNPSLFDMICRFKKNQKEKILIELYSKADQIIEKKLDILGYLKFFEEYVFLKEILLDDFSNLSLTLRNRPKLYK